MLTLHHNHVFYGDDSRTKDETTKMVTTNTPFALGSQFADKDFGNIGCCSISNLDYCYAQHLEATEVYKQVMQLQ